MKTASNSRVLRTIPLVLIVGLLCSSAYGKIIYVDDDSMGANDGTSWENAYNFLQDALADANSAPKPVEIRVAQGVYTPDSNSAIPDGTGDREATFRLINGVTLRGGYAGIAEPDPDARDVAAYETILSGDLNGDDAEVAKPIDFPRDLIWVEPTRAENSYRVLTGSSTDETAVLDGFTITGGLAGGPRLGDEYPYDYRFQHGGGMYNYEGSPTLTNCTFSGNSARFLGGGMYNGVESSPTLTNCIFSGNGAFEGGGMYNDASSPTLTNCTFSGNEAVGEVYKGGGGMCNRESSPILTNCTFIGNSTIGSIAAGGGGMCNLENSSPTLTNCTFSDNSIRDMAGGGMNNVQSNPTLIRCTFSGNSARHGGGIHNRRSSPTLTNCTFSGNSAYRDGGGMFNLESSPILTNCIFSRNSAYRDGGGMYNRESNPILTNCTFAQNSADYGNALACDSHSSESPSNVELVNCILWDGGDEIQNNDNSTIIITYSNIQYSNLQGGFPGEGNIDTDPLFVDLGYYDENGTPADANDDYWVDGDYHLKSQAGRWNPNSESWVQDDVINPCIDAGDPMSPIGLEPFPNGGFVNMGAYGCMSEASKSYFGEPICGTIVAGDINGDCQVNRVDLEIMALHWTDEEPLPLP